jgi:siroheme synthase-like protein
MAKSYLPLSLSMNDRPCLIVGGGNVALRKIETLLDFDPRITVVAPQPLEKIEFHAQKGRIRLEKRGYQSPEAAQYRIVIAASDDNDLNKTVYEDCQKAGVPVNVVDDPDHCDFIFPAILRRDCLTVAVSTGGKAPFLSGHLRLVLENIFPEHWTRIAKYAASFRLKVMNRWPGNRPKKIECFGRFIETDWKNLLKEKEDREIDQELDKLLEN